MGLQGSVCAVIAHCRDSTPHCTVTYRILHRTSLTRSGCVRCLTWVADDVYRARIRPSAISLSPRAPVVKQRHLECSDAREDSPAKRGFVLPRGNAIHGGGCADVAAANPPRLGRWGRGRGSSSMHPPALPRRFGGSPAATYSRWWASVGLYHACPAKGLTGPLTGAARQYIPHSGGCTPDTTAESCCQTRRI